MTTIINSESNRHDLINLLPSELKFKIFSFLDAESLCRTAQTCSHWKEIADYPGLWSIVFRNTFPAIDLRNGIDAKKFAFSLCQVTISSFDEMIERIQRFAMKVPLGQWGTFKCVSLSNKKHFINVEFYHVEPMRNIPFEPYIRHYCFFNDAANEEKEHIYDPVSVSLRPIWKLDFQVDYYYIISMNTYMKKCAVRQFKMWLKLNLITSMNDLLDVDQSIIKKREIKSKIVNGTISSVLNLSGFIFGCYLGSLYAKTGS